ncbi:hypothetical protein J6590_035384 [Homalodisca vitripennis]|nr:hypothetical protein J6590_035384 [Homalodisca vitripennis]
MTSEIVIVHRSEIINCTKSKFHPRRTRRQNLRYGDTPCDSLTAVGIFLNNCRLMVERAARPRPCRGKDCVSYARGGGGRDDSRYRGRNSAPLIILHCACRPYNYTFAHTILLSACPTISKSIVNAALIMERFDSQWNHYYFIRAS